MSDLATLRDDMEREFTRQLAPELGAMGASRVYVLWESECCRGGDSWLGVFHCWFSQWYRGAIGDRWQGAGPCWIVNDHQVGKLARKDPYAFREIAWSVSVHEAAHSILIPTMTFSVDEASEECKSIMVDVLAESSEDESPIDSTFDGSHGLEFSRVATHLAWRVAESRGGGISNIHDPLDVAIVGLWPATFALRAELKSMRAVPLSEIAKLPIPAALTQEYRRRLEEFGLTDRAATVAAGRDGSSAA